MSDKVARRRIQTKIVREPDLEITKDLLIHMLQIEMGQKVHAAPQHMKDEVKGRIEVLCELLDFLAGRGLKITLRELPQ